MSTASVRVRYGKIEHVVHQMHEPLSLARDDLRVLAMGLIGTIVTGDQSVAIKANQCKRGLYFVRNTADKIRLS